MDHRRPVRCRSGSDPSPVPRPTVLLFWPTANCTIVWHVRLTFESMHTLHHASGKVTRIVIYSVEHSLCGLLMLEDTGPSTDRPLLGSASKVSVCKKCDFCPGPSFCHPIPLSLVILYLGFGTFMYTLVVPLAGPQPHMNVTWIDAAYFSLVTLTTVGYGDFHPGANDPWCKLFTLFFAIVGVSFVGWALGKMAEAAFSKVADVGSTEHTEDQKEPCGKSLCLRCGPCGRYWIHISPVWRNLIITFCVLVLLLGAGVLVFVFQEGMTFLDAIYYVVISATTIGYGDESPKSIESKIFSIFWLVIVSGYYD